MYVFGLLEGDEVKRIAQHLNTGCAVCNAEVGAVEESIGRISVALDPVSVSPQLKGRLLTRIHRERRNSPEQAEPGIFVLRGGRGAWKQTQWAGVAYRLLHRDASTGLTTSLLRIDPGGRFPAHHHIGIEQSWVVEGSCRIGSVTIQVGDFAWANAGTDHGVLESEDGCILLIVSMQKHEAPT
jgi:quercetin dioxygenase-like cupin family protein